MKSLRDLINEKNPVDKNKYISREFQDYGVRLAQDLGDLKHKSLYIKLAKTIDRKILEQARRFVIDSNANSKGALFMWKIKQLTSNTKLAMRQTLGFNPYDRVQVRMGDGGAIIEPMEDLLDMTELYKAPKGKSALKARAYMEKHYKRE